MILTVQFVSRAFYAIACLDTIIKFVKWIKIKNSSSKSFLNLQIKYFISFFAIQIPLIIQSPFIHRRYVDDEMSDIDIAHIKIVYNVSAAIFSIFIGQILSFFEHGKIIAISTIFSVIASILRGIGTKKNFLICSILVGFASSNIRVSFDDWFILEESKITDCLNSHFIFTENLSLLNIVVSVIFLSFSDYLQRKSGTDGVFYFTAALQFIGSIVVYFTLRGSENNSENKLNDVKQGIENLNDNNQSIENLNEYEKLNKNALDNQKNSFKEAFKVVLKSPDKQLIPMILLDQLYGVLISLFWPSVPSYFPDKSIPMAKIIGMGQLSILLGTMLISLICKYVSSSVALPISFFLSSLCDIIMTFIFDDKFKLYWMIFFLCICDGGNSSLMLGLKKNIFPGNVRSYILGINKLFQSIYSSILIALSERYPKRLQPLFSAGVLLSCSALSLIIQIIEFRKHKELKDR